MTAWESRGPVEAKPNLSAISSTRKSATYAAALKTLDKLEEELHVGDDYLIMATDYPHADAAEKFPKRTVGDLANNSNLSEATRRKILWDNPARLYGSARFRTRSEPPSTNTQVQLNS
ncbi:MAG TPA: amidohydrolase family protein [Verrucomicrobiae bacterium]|nr:amidohydrolase family protein [Verrucomicrobiae bacterium]